MKNKSFLFLFLLCLIVLFIFLIPINISAEECEGKEDPDNPPCLFCHDGTLASDRRPGPKEHPLWKNYNRVYLDNPGEYNPISQIDKSIKFIRGRIVCVSCHSYQSNYPFMVTLPLLNSDLCLECHIK